MLGGAALLNQGIDGIKAPGVEVEDVIMPRPLIVGSGGSVVRCIVNGPQWIVREERNGSSEFVASCRATRILGSADVARSDLTAEAVRDRCVPADVDALYGMLSRQGVQFGRGYRNLAELFLGEEEAIARVEVTHASVLDRSLTLLHPATLDAGIQLLGLCGMKTCGVCLPFNVQSARLFSVEEQPQKLWAYARVSASSARSVEGTVTLFGDGGEVYAVLEGLTCRQASTDTRVQECVFEMEWMPLPPATESTRHEDAHLLLSREAVAGVLPKGWRLSVAKEEAQLLAEASSQRWTTVVLWGSNTEEDVELGLRLMQTAQAERLVFVTGRLFF